MEKAVKTHRRETKEYFRTLWWSADVTSYGFPRRTLSFSQTIGFIGSRELFWSLEPECPVRMLTKANWKAIFELGLVDIVLVEPCLNDVTGQWKHTLFDCGHENTDLRDLVQGARSAGIPVVGWITSDRTYHHLQKGFSRLFDTTYCADEAFAGLLKAEGIPAIHLPPAIQPTIYNPFVELDGPDIEPPEVLFDGWTSISNSSALREELARFKPLGLKIIESRAAVRQSKMVDNAELAPCVLGCVTPRNRLLLLKHAKILIQALDDVRPRQESEQMALEAAACRTVVVHVGQLKGKDLRKEFAIVCKDWEHCRELVEALQSDAVRWMRDAQLAWRSAHRDHSISNRIAYIFQELGFETPAGRFPRATIVTPTYRPGNLERILKQFRAQSWENKELVVVANTENESTWSQDLVNGGENESLVFLPRSHWAGTAMNIGANRSTGDYVFRMDDDDFYGSNYVMDMCLHAISCDPDVFGKQPAFVYSQARKSVYWKTHINRSPSIFPISHFSYPQRKSVSGFTTATTVALLRERGFPNDAFGYADTAFFLRESRFDVRVAICDPLNAVYERREDQASHTWESETDWDHPNLEHIGSAPDVVFV